MSNCKQIGGCGCGSTRSFAKQIGGCGCGFTRSFAKQTGGCGEMLIQSGGCRQPSQKTQAWRAEVNRIRQQHPEIGYKQALKMASQQRKQKGGSGSGSDSGSEREDKPLSFNTAERLLIQYYQDMMKNKSITF